MDKLIEQALKKHKIVRYLDTFEKVMLTYKTLLEAEMEAKNISSNPVLAAVLSKYIQYIRDVEGTDYILIHDERYASDVKFTDEEWQLLTEVAKNCG